MSDSLASGRVFRTLNVVDDLSRICPVIVADHSIPAERVSQALDRPGARYGYPEVIVVDNGPEFTSRALDQWAYERGIQLYFIQPGKPVQNAFVESINGSFRDECLNQNLFVTLPDARRVIEAWRQDYNCFRPHESLGWMTPEEFERTQGLDPPGRLPGSSISLGGEEKKQETTSSGTREPQLSVVLNRG